MPISRFPNGISSFGVPVLGSGMQIPPSSGNYYFVSSTTGSSNNDGLSTTTPLLTVASAISKTTVNNGDVIVMMPNHVETIAAAGGWTPLAGTAIVGMGWGAARPKITFSATTSTILVSAANCMFQNFVCTSGVAELVTMFSVSGVECVINAVDVMETTAVSCISFFTFTATALRFVIANCRHNTTTIPVTATGWITGVGNDGMTIENNEIIVNRANSATSCIIQTLTPACTNVMIRNNLMSCGTTGASRIGVSLFAGTTGIVADNRIFDLGSTLAGNFGIANCAGFNNLVVHTVTKSGLLDPVVDS
jgi:hypothetical protein